MTTATRQAISYQTVSFACEDYYKALVAASCSRSIILMFGYGDLFTAFLALLAK